MDESCNLNFQGNKQKGKKKRINKGEITFIKQHISSFVKQYEHQQNLKLIKEKQQQEGINIENEILEQQKENELIYNEDLIIRIFNFEKEFRTKRMQEYLTEVLPQLQYFKEFKQVQGKHNLFKLTKLINLNTFDKFQTIFEYKQQEKYFHIILKGKVIIKQPVMGDNKQIIEWKDIIQVEAGQSFGEFSAGNKVARRTFKAVAQEITLVCQLEKQDYRDYCETFNERILNKQLSYLSEFEVFQNFSFAHLKLVNLNTQKMQLQYKQQVLNQNDEVEQLYLIKTGELLLTRCTPHLHTKKEIEVAVINQTQVLDLHDHSPFNSIRQFNCYCLSNSATLLAIKKDIFLYLLIPYPQNLQIFQNEAKDKLIRYTQKINHQNNNKNQQYDFDQITKGKQTISLKYLKYSVPQIIRMKKKEEISLKNNSFIFRPKDRKFSPLQTKKPKFTAATDLEEDYRFKFIKNLQKNYQEEQKRKQKKWHVQIDYNLYSEKKKNNNLEKKVDRSGCTTLQQKKPNRSLNKRVLAIHSGESANRMKTIV